MRGPLRQLNICRGERSTEIAGEEVVKWEGRSELNGLVNLIHILLREIEAQSFDVGFDVRYTPLSNNREDVRCLEADPCESLSLKH